MVRCAERWKELLLAAGADRAEVMPSNGNPIVYAERLIGDDRPTVLVYSHYDVMPAEPLDLWKSDPFKAEIRDGRLWARGADDDKGQAMVQAKAFEYLVRQGEMNCNVPPPVISPAFNHTSRSPSRARTRRAPPPSLASVCRHR